LQGRGSLSSRYQPVDQTDRKCARAVERFALEHHIQGRARAYELHGSHGAAEAGVNAKHHFGQPEQQLGVVGARPVGTRQCEFETASQHKTVQRRHARAGKILQLIQHPLSRAN
jgi:hypothetical protein